MPKIIHNRKDCISCGMCALQAPEFWEMSSEDGKAKLKGASQKDEIFIKKIKDEEINDNLQAAEFCPVNIIKILGDDNKEIKS